MEKLAIFDLDGTLIDAYTLIYFALNRARKYFGYEDLSFSVVKKNVGRGEVALIRRFFSEREGKKALEIYRDSYQKLIKEGKIKLMDGTEELLEFLKEKGLKIAVATNRSRFSVEILSRKLDIFKLFDLVITADDVEKAKPFPEMLEKICAILKIRKENCFYVGDMDIDLKTGKNAGIETFIVLTGSSAKEEILKVDKNSKIFPDLISLKNYLASVLI